MKVIIYKSHRKINIYAQKKSYYDIVNAEAFDKLDNNHNQVIKR